MMLAIPNDGDDVGAFTPIYKGSLWIIIDLGDHNEALIVGTKLTTSSTL